MQTVMRKSISLCFKLIMLMQILYISLVMFIDRFFHKKIIILYSEEPGHFQYFLPIIQSLKKKTDLIAYYIATDSKISKNERRKINIVKQKIFNLAITRYLVFADMFISASVYGEGPETACKVNISHNLPVKVVTYPKKYIEKYDVHFLTGPLQRAQYETMFDLYKIDKNRVKLFNIGYPKLDALISDDYQRDEILKSLELAPDHPTVLYAPTWDPGASLRSFGKDLINVLVGLKNVNIVTKLHPVSYTNKKSPNYEFYTGGKDWKLELAIFNDYENFIHVTSDSINDLLLVADVMVTDISSVALEFITLDRPVIYIDCPLFNTQTLHDLGQDSDIILNDSRYNAGRDTGLIVYNLDDLTDAVKSCLRNPQQNSEKRRALTEELLYNKGRGADESAWAIINLLNLKTIC
jgi:hypothetical protein